ncbi:MAG: ATP-binding protein [Acidimicrobiia bacterium]|nr:ATP-binding protein [Acidimicrobiia bacterium]
MRRGTGNLSIRTKTTVFVIVTLGVLTALMATVQFRTSLERIREIEDDQAMADADRVVRQLENSQDDLGGTTADWAWWDDTYDFIQDDNEDYRDSNLYADAFVPLGVDLVAFVNRDGEAVAQAWYRDEEERDVPAEVLTLGQPGGRLADFSEDTQATPGGLVAAGDDVFLITARAILPSATGDDWQGVLMMGRHVDEDFVAQLAQLTDVNLSVEQCVGGNCVDLSDEPKIIKDGDVVVTSSTIDAIDGSPILRAEVRAPRTVYNESLNGIQRALIILLAVGLGAVVFTVGGLNRLFIQPLETLGTTVAEVTRRNDPSLRAPVNRTDEIGELAGAVNVMLARLENTQRQLVDAKEKVEGASEAKSRFLSRVSHELRTPINGVLAYAQLLQLDHPDGDAGESIDQIITSARHITTLVDEFLDIARIEAGAIPITIETVDPTSVSWDAINMTQPLAEAEGTSVTLHGNDNVQALADPVRLRQVILNLVSNAIKYGRGDEPIAITVDSDGTSTIIEVRDHGPGIPANQLDRLFVPFDRLDADSSNQKGSGVGLSVTKQLVELMNGTIDVESQVGTGTAFTITLPAPPGENSTNSNRPSRRNLTEAAARR